MSKSVIFNSIKDKLNFYNIRIFAVFDENEANTRFIKSNILRYINKEPLVIHKNKTMDFFYTKDLIELIDFYIKNESPPKQIDCTYATSPTLHDVALQINNLTSHKSDIQILDSSATDNSYTGTHFPLLNYIGLKEGIRRVYNCLSKT
jgi:nucleoside-diphosphate-sugar epimerase